MLITEVSPQKKGNRYNLFIDGEFRCGIFEDSLSKFYLYKGKEITETDIEEIMKNEIRDLFWNRVVSFCSKSLKTEKDAVQYMKKLLLKYRSEFPKGEVEELFEAFRPEILTDLKKYNLIDDAKYAGEFISSRIKNRPRSKKLIEYELLKKGVSKEEITKAIDNAQIDEKQVVKNILLKKYHSESLTIEDKKKIQYLQSKGFDWDTISSIIRE